MKLELTKEEKRVVRRVLKRVQTTHWIQNYYEVRVGRKRCNCLVGMVNIETDMCVNDASTCLNSNLVRESVLSNIRLLIARRQKKGLKNIYIEEWNDSCGRTREDVEGLLLELLDPLAYDLNCCAKMVRPK